MLKRVGLYITSNFTKMLSTLVMFTVMMSLLGALMYVYITVGNRIGETEVFRTNYVADDEKLYDSQYKINDDAGNIMYQDLYDKAKSLEGLEAYKIDSGMNNAYVVAEEEIDFTTFSNYMLGFEVADNEKQMDFYTGNVKLLSGEFNGSGIIVSQEFSDLYKVNIGDSIDLSSVKNLENDFEFGGSAKANYSAKVNLEVSGVFEVENNNEEGFIKPEYKVYMSQEVYDNTMKVLDESIVAKYEGENAGSVTNNFTRFLAQYDNENSLQELNKYASDNYPSYEQIDSTKSIEKSLKPLNKFNTLILIITIVTAVIAVVGMYLNMYLKIDKRRSEFIALLSFGVNSFKLSVQVFLEQLLFLILSVPLAYLFIKYIVKFSIEIIKKYFIVLIDTQVNSSEEISGFMYSYIHADSRDVVNFESANIMVIIGGAFVFLAISLLVLSIIEMMRRYKNVKKV